ncbi:MAG: hypothetical protein FWD12_08870, partial [Alphaproteobacteria bacterium]|nr:hypothetical protein [Alphaproteobacteria bacterium]
SAPTLITGGNQPPSRNPGGDKPPGDRNPPSWRFGDHNHHHHRWVFRDGGWVYVDAPDDAETSSDTVTSAAASGPCNCLTKTYTTDGLAVFADICTKESASAPATDDFADASKVPTTTTPISQVPTAPNYAGRTEADIMPRTGR